MRKFSYILFAFSFILFFVSICISAGSYPNLKTEEIGGDERFYFDFVNVGDPILSDEHYSKISTAMATVWLANSTPKTSHTNIVVFNEHIPEQVEKSRAIAGYLPNEDIFFIDAKKVKAEKSDVFIKHFSAHEAYHRVQAYEGRLQDYVPSLYEGHATDKIEIEASQEAVNYLASNGREFMYVERETRLVPEDKNVYLNNLQSEVYFESSSVSGFYLVRYYFLNYVGMF